jgi:FtsH-binding integral membrane protein
VAPLRSTCAMDALASGRSLLLAPRRGYAKPSRFTNLKKKRVEVLEKEAEVPPHGSVFQSAQQQQQHQEQFPPAGSPGTSFTPYLDSRDKREDQQHESQWDALTGGTVAHMRKVYATLAAGIGIAAGASIITMATPLIGMHPLVPGIASIVPLMGLMYTSKHTHSQTLRAGMFAAFAGLSGMSIAPLMMVAMKVSPIIVPQALLLTTGLFGAMTGLSLMAKPGATLRWGVPLGGGLLLLMATGIGSMFVPVTSAWYPLLHSFQLYGGLALFTAYIAYDTQKMIDEYEMGEDDHLKHAVDLFIDFKVRPLATLRVRSFHPRRPGSSPHGAAGYM